MFFALAQAVNIFTIAFYEKIIHSIPDQLSILNNYGDGFPVK